MSNWRRRLAVLIGIGFVALTGSRWIGPLFPGAAYAEQLRRESRRTADGWCWREICPGTTSIDEAYSTLMSGRGPLYDRVMRTVYGSLIFVNGQDFAPRSNYVYHDPAVPTRVYSVLLSPPRDTFTLGDAVAQFGSPLMYAWGYPASYALEICFGAEVCVSTLAEPGVLRPAMPVDRIQLLAAGTLARRRSEYLPWRGFTVLRAE